MQKTLALILRMTEKKRISSKITILVAWIIPMALLGFWTPVSVAIFFTDLPLGLKIYLIIATVVMWIVYLILKPWRLKTVYETEKGLILIAKSEKLIPYETIKEVKSVWNIKLSPVVIEYLDLKERKKYYFISRLTSPTFALPFERNPIVDKINERKN